MRKLNVVWGKPTLKNPKRIVLCETKSEDSVKKLHRQHKEENGKGIIFNYVVAKDGEFWMGRGKIKGKYSDAITLALQGKFYDNAISTEQFEGAVKALRDLAAEYGLSAKDVAIDTINKNNMRCEDIIKEVFPEAFAEEQEEEQEYEEAQEKEQESVSIVDCYTTEE